MKYISKEKAFEKIKNELKNSDESAHFTDICKNIVDSLKGTKYGYTSVIRRIVERHFNSTKCLKNTSKSKVTLKNIQKIAIKNNVMLAKWRTPNSLYAELCKKINIKNSMNNRNKLYRQLRTLKNNNIQLYLEENELMTQENNSLQNVSNSNSLNDIQEENQIVSNENWETNMKCENFESSKLVRSSPNDGDVNDDVYDDNYMFKPNSSIDKITFSSASSFHSTPKNEETKTLNNITPETYDIPKCLLNISSPNTLGEVLPKNSINCIRQLKVSSFKDCKIIEGFFDLGIEIWHKIFKEEKLNFKYYPYCLRTKIRNHVNNVCIIIFKYVNYSKKRKLCTVYAECKYNSYSCKKFKILLCQQKVTVYSTSLNYFHSSVLTASVSKLERDIVKSKVIHEMPFNYKKKTLLEANQIIIKKGKNLQQIKSDNVIRKIKSEAISKFDRNQDDIQDLILMQNDHPDFIQEISLPFCVKLYSLRQVNVLKQESKWCLPIVHFDATGGLVRAPLKNCKKILFYSGVISLEYSQRIYSVFSMISSCHDSNTIFKLLNDFRFFCERNNFWPAFSGVVTDFSFANLHAITKAFNRCSLIDYLEATYLFIENKDKGVHSLIPVYLCSAHFMKMVSKDVNRVEEKEVNRGFFKDLIASAILMRTIQHLDIFFENVYIVTNSKYISNQLEDAITNLKLISKQPQMYTDECNYKEFSGNGDQGDGLLKSSPYFKRFSANIKALNIISSQFEELNPFYNKHFFRYYFVQISAFVSFMDGCYDGR